MRWAGGDPLDRRDPHALPRVTWRREMLASGVLNVLLGGWLVASPVVLGYEAGDPGWHDAVAGLAIGAVAVAASAGRAARRTS